MENGIKKEEIHALERIAVHEKEYFLAWIYLTYSLQELFNHIHVHILLKIFGYIFFVLVPHYLHWTNAQVFFQVRLQFVFSGDFVLTHEKSNLLIQDSPLYRPEGEVSNDPGLGAALSTQGPLSSLPLSPPV